MKKLTSIFFICIIMCLCGCNGQMLMEESVLSENESNDTIQYGTNGVQLNPLEKYSGTWYGYGSDSTEAVTSGGKLTFIDESSLEFDEETFVLISADTAESISDYESSSGGKDSKLLLVFGRDSNDELALETYLIRKSDRRQFTQSMYYYRQKSRPNYQDFIKGSNSGTTSSSASTQSKSANSEKDAFQQRYNRLSSKNIEAAPQTQMNIASKELYEEWDLLLNDVYKYLKNTKSSSEFEDIKNDEIRWIEEKEAAIERNRSEYEGGSAAPLVANTTAIEYTKERCSYLISLID